MFFAGDSAGHCFPLSGEGIRTAFYFGIAAARELRSVLAGERSRERRWRATRRSALATPAFGRALRLQRLIPALPPRVLTGVLRASGASPSSTAPSAGTSTRPTRDFAERPTCIRRGQSGDHARSPSTSAAWSRASCRTGRTGEVLTLAYMNAEALERTRATGELHFWSRSRDELWHKGATRGNVQRVRALRYDCDGDALLALVEPAGPACHTGERTCFHRGELEPPARRTRRCRRSSARSPQRARRARPRAPTPPSCSTTRR